MSRGAGDGLTARRPVHVTERRTRNILISPLTAGLRLTGSKASPLAAPHLAGIDINSIPESFAGLRVAGQAGEGQSGGPLMKKHWKLD